VAYNALVAAGRKPGTLDFDAARLAAVAEGVKAAGQIGTVAVGKLSALQASVDGALGDKLAADPTVSALGGTTATATAAPGETATATAGPTDQAQAASEVAPDPAPAAPTRSPEMQAVLDEVRAIVADSNARKAAVVASAPAAETVGQGASSAALDLATKLIGDFEGCKLAPYWDGIGKRFTIGYGLTHLPSGPVTASTPPLTQAEAETTLAAEVSTTLDAVHRMITRPMTDDQAAALTSLAYNVGDDALHGSTLLTLFNARHDEEAAAQFSRWCHSHGVVVPGLVTRRAKERAVFEGATPVDAFAAAGPVPLPPPVNPLGALMAGLGAASAPAT